MAGITRPTNEVLGRLCFLANTRGIIPNPINATRIDKSVTDVANTTTTIYPVPTGKILFISSAWLRLANATAAISGIYLKITTAVPNDVIMLLGVAGGGGQGNVLSNQYHPAIEVPAGYLIRLISPAASVFGDGGFSGWLEDV